MAKKINYRLNETVHYKMYNELYVCLQKNMFSNFVFVPNKNVSCKRCITSINIHAHFVAVDGVYVLLFGKEICTLSNVLSCRMYEILKNCAVFIMP